MAATRQPRITTSQVNRVLQLHADGMGRNDIARLVGIGTGTVTRLVNQHGGTFDRSKVAAATAAKIADTLALRAELEHTLLVDAKRLRGQMWEPHTYIDHGGKYFDRVEWTQAEPSPTDKRNLMQAAVLAVDRSLKIATISKGRDEDDAKSMLVDLATSLGMAWKQAQAAEPPA